MKAILRALRLLRLMCRQSVLEAEEENARGLLEDYANRLANTQQELRYVRNQIVLLRNPQSLINQAIHRGRT